MVRINHGESREKYGEGYVSFELQKLKSYNKMDMHFGGSRNLGLEKRKDFLAMGKIV